VKKSKLGLLIEGKAVRRLSFNNLKYVPQVLVQQVLPYLLAFDEREKPLRVFPLSCRPNFDFFTSSDS